MALVISFHGCDHKCGVSMIAQSTAEKLAASSPQKNVLLIHTEQGTGSDYCPSVSETLENIRPYLAERLFDFSEIISDCKYKNNLFILGGASKPGSMHLYNPDMAEYLIESVRKHFDYVICDTGSEIEHGMCLGALCSSEVIYQITSQSEIALKRFVWQQSLYSQLRLKIDKLIINKYSPKEVNSKELIAKRLGFNIDDIICVKYSNYGVSAEDYGRSILFYKDRAFSKSIDLIVSDILQRSLSGDVRP